MTQLIDLGKLRFHFAGDWVSTTTYESNDIVKYGGNVYVYTYALKSSGTLPTTETHWALMIEGFNFAGEFDTATNYYIGDTVAHGGVVYVAIADSFNQTPPNPTYWSRFMDGIQYEGDYDGATAYQKNDVVVYGGSIYIAKQDTTNNLPTNTTYWDKFVEGVSPSGVYNDLTDYVPNDLVAYGANIYRAKVETTGNTPSDAAYWELYIGGFKFWGTYDNNKEYYVNDIVIYGNSIYRSKETQTAVLPTVTSGWEVLTQGNSFAGTYDAATTYYLNDIVYYGNNQYRSLTTQVGNTPTTLTDWELYVSSTNYRAAYSNATTYYIGDLVDYGGNLYLASQETTGNVPTDTNNWTLYVSGFSYEGDWSSTTQYYIGQTISYGGSLYQALADNLNSNPSTQTSDWDKITYGIKNSGVWAPSTEYATDEVVTYGGNTFISIVAHASNADFNVDNDTNGYWQKFNSGIRFRGTWSSTTDYLKDDVVKAGSSSFIANQDVTGGNSPASDPVPAEWSQFATGAEGFLSKDGDTMLGYLTLYADPTDALHAATKSYVDRFVNATDGGTVEGPLVFDDTAGGGAGLTLQNGADMEIDGGVLSLTNGASLNIDGTSSLAEVTVDGDINLNGGNLDTTQTSINLVNANATTVNFAGDATTLSIGASTGTTTVNNNLVVVGTTAFNGGTIELGDGDADNVVFGADVNSAIIPNIDDTYDLGTSIKEWRDLFVDGTATIDTVVVDETLSVTGNTYLTGELDTGIGGTVYTNTSLDPTGFDNSHPDTRGIIEFSDDGTRIFSIGTDGVVTESSTGNFADGTAHQTAAAANTLVVYPDGIQPNFTYWINGVRYEKVGLQSVSLGAVTGQHYIYFDGGVLTASTTRDDASLISKAHVAGLNISPSNNKITYISDERHGISIDGDTLVHTVKHELKDGLSVMSGFGLNAQAGDEDYTSTYAGVLRNADLRVDVPVQTTHRFATRLVADWKISDFADNLLSNQLGVLQSVTVTDGGSGYRGATTSAVVEGDGENATVELQFSAAPIDSVTLVAGGYDYDPGTTIAITGDGSGATASITIPPGRNLAKQVDSGITLTSAGNGYTNPVITVVNDPSDSTGTGAVISYELDLGTEIADVHMLTLGSNYDAAQTTATITGDGTGATATVTVVAGAVTDINLTNAGSGYTTASVTITDASGNGSGATAEVNTLKNEIVDYVITSVGSGYTTASVTINGDGHDATATATVTAGGVTDIQITNAGHGYTYATMTITGDGTGATAEPRLSGYPIASISFADDDARGKNYTVAPTVTIVEDGFGIVVDNGTLGGGNPVAAAISTQLSTGNTIDSVALTNAGSGYTEAFVTLSNIGNGNGGDVDISTLPSSVLGVTVTNQGRHYSYANIIVTSDTGSGATFETSFTPVPQYNQYVDGVTQYDLNNIPTNKFTITYFVAINGVDNVVKIPSEYLFDRIPEAYIKATEEIEEMRDYGLPFDNYKFIGFSIINHLGELQTITGTNQGDVEYYDLTDRNSTDLTLGTVDTNGTGIAGRSLSVTASGTSTQWLGATESDEVYYVAPHGSDDPHAGRNLTAPFASIKYACEQAGVGATIFVKTGTYTEETPIVVKDSVAVVGDNQRTVIVQPAVGYEANTMWQMSNGSILNKMTFKGVTGWVPAVGNEDDITASTVTAVVVGFEPTSPITTKSPYVLECSFIGSGAIGAYVDGDAHASGNHSMIFHGYTIINDNGVGYWCHNGALAEIVSCFTYYNYFGYTCTGGSKIRSLNGNCSYGEWGATSAGFDANETPIVGALVGEQLNFVYNTGAINVGDTITDDVTGATATVTNVQYSANKIYIKDRVGTFSTPNTFTASSGGTGTTASGEVEDTDGYVLIVDGLSEEPRPGASVSLSDDTISYVIQSVSGTYVDATSEMVLVLAQEKPTGSANDAVVTLRYNYSQVRLTGHDFLSIGTGGVATTNYPGEPTQTPAPGNETNEVFPGRVYYVSTDQDGNFRVGEYFKIDQATGTATLNANAFNLAGLTSLRLGSIGAQLGETINEFSSDETLGGNSNTAVPTEYAVKTYVDRAAIQTAFTKDFDIANATFDANGNPTAFIADNITYSNVVWGQAGTNWSLFGGADATYYRPESWTETTASGSSQNIVVNYNTTTGLVDTVVTTTVA